MLYVCVFTYSIHNKYTQYKFASMMQSSLTFINVSFSYNNNMGFVL